jgi:hypothetical protein
MKFDLIEVSGKNSASTRAWSKPDMGPQSIPSNLAANMK